MVGGEAAGDGLLEVGELPRRSASRQRAGGRARGGGGGGGGVVRQTTGEERGRFGSDAGVWLQEHVEEV